MPTSIINPGPERPPITITPTNANPPASQSGDASKAMNGFCGGEERISTQICNSLFPAVTMDGVGNINVVWQDTRDGNFEIYTRFLQSRLDQRQFKLNQNIAFDPATGKAFNFSCSGFSGSANVSGFSGSAASVLVTQGGGRLDVSASSRTIVLTAGQGSLDFQSLGVTAGASVSMLNGLNSGKTFYISRLLAPTVAELNFVDSAKADAGFVYSISAADTGLSSDEVRITCNKSSSMFPDVIADSKGRFHCVYQDDAAGNFDLYYIQMYPTSVGKASCSGASVPITAGSFGPVPKGSPGSVSILLPATNPTTGQIDPTLPPHSGSFIPVGPSSIGSTDVFFASGNKLLPDQVPIQTGPILTQTGLHRLFQDFTNGSGEWVGVSKAADRKLWVSQAAADSITVAPDYVAPVGQPAASPGDFGTKFTFKNIAFVAQTPPDKSVEVTEISLPLKPKCLPNTAASAQVQDLKDLSAAPIEPVPPGYQDPVDLSGILTSPLVTVDNTTPSRFIVSGDSSGTVFTNILTDNGQGRMSRFVFNCSTDKKAKEPPRFILGQLLCGTEHCALNLGSSTTPPAPPPTAQYKITLEIWQGPDYRFVNDQLKSAQVANCTKVLSKEFAFDPGDTIDSFNFRRGELKLEDGHIFYVVPIAGDNVEFFIEGVGGGHDVWSTNSDGAFVQYYVPFTVAPNSGLSDPIYYEGFLHNPTSGVVVGPSSGSGLTSISGASGTLGSTTSFDASGTCWTVNFFGNFAAVSGVTVGSTGILNAENGTLAGHLTDKPNFGPPDIFGAFTVLSRDPVSQTMEIKINSGACKNYNALAAPPKLPFVILFFIDGVSVNQAVGLCNSIIQNSCPGSNSSNGGSSPTDINPTPTFSAKIDTLDLVIPGASDAYGNRLGLAIGGTVIATPGGTASARGVAVTLATGPAHLDSITVSVKGTVTLTITGAENGLPNGDVIFTTSVSGVGTGYGGTLNPLTDQTTVTVDADVPASFAIYLKSDATFDAPLVAIINGVGLDFTSPCNQNPLQPGLGGAGSQTSTEYANIVKEWCLRPFQTNNNEPSKFLPIPDFILAFNASFSTATGQKGSGGSGGSGGGGNGGNDGGAGGTGDISSIIADTPIRITKSKGNSVHPRLAIDSHDNMWVVFHSDRTGNNEVYAGRYICGKWTTSALGGVDIQVTNAGAHGKTASFPNVKVDDNKDANVVWQSDDTASGNSDIFYAKTIGGQGKFGPALAISASTGQAQMPDISISSSAALSATAGGCKPGVQGNVTNTGRTTVVWHDNRFGNYEILAGVKQNGNWVSSGQNGTDVRITQAAGDNLFPRAFSDMHGNVRVVYHGFRRGLKNPWIFMSTYVASNDKWDSTGQGGSDLPLTPSGTAQSLHADIVIDPSDGVCVVWHDTRFEKDNADQGEEVMLTYCPRSDSPVKYCGPICTNVEAFVETDFNIIDCATGKPIDITTSPSICLEITSPGATFFRVSEDGGTYSDWIPFVPGSTLDTTIAAWTLGPGSGTKNICVQVQDATTIGFPVCKQIVMQSELPTFQIKFFRDADLSIPLDTFQTHPVAPAGDVFLKITSSVPLINPPTFDIISRGIRLAFNQQTVAVNGVSGFSGSSGFSGTAAAGAGSFAGNVISTPVGTEFSAFGGTDFKGRFTVHRDDGFFHIDGLARIVPHGKSAAGEVF